MPGVPAAAADTYGQLGILAQRQERYDQAEANYRKALDIYLDFGDQHNAADTYHNLGTLAHDQKRYPQAETDYRKALDIHRESDPRAASNTATLLGAVLAALGQHREAARIFLYAAVTWHQETGQWAGEDLQGLRRERAAIGPEEFTSLVKADLPADLAGELTVAIDTADSTGDADEPGSEDHAAGS